MIRISIDSTDSAKRLIILCALTSIAHRYFSLSQSKAVLIISSICASERSAKRCVFRALSTLNFVPERLNDTEVSIHRYKRAERRPWQHNVP